MSDPARRGDPLTFLPLTVHVSLLLWLRDRAPRTFDLLGSLATRGQVELLTGGFYEPILPILPDRAPARSGGSRSR